MSLTPERAPSTSSLDSVRLPNRPEFLTLVEDAKSTTLEVRSDAYKFIFRHGSELPGSILDTIAFEASYTSIAKAALHHRDHLSYAARVALASKFFTIGRDNDVVTCLGAIDRQDATGLRLYCDALSRGRFTGKVKMDLEPYYFAAGLGDCSAELTWLQNFGMRKLQGTEQKAAIDRLIDMASHDHIPEARVTLSEMLINNQLTSSDEQLAYRGLSLASMDGYPPAKLALLQHFPDDFRSNTRTFLADFLNAGYFPGIAHCCEKLSSSEERLPILDSLLKAYLWHPEHPIGTEAHTRGAIIAAAQIPVSEMKEVQAWARGKVLVLDTTYA